MTTKTKPVKRAAAKTQPRTYDRSKTKGKRGKQGEGGGRPNHEPNDDKRKLVWFGVAIGHTRAQIAKIMNISEDTLKKYYDHELSCGDIEANLQVGGAIFRDALAGRPGAQNLWAVNRLGWKRNYETPITDDSEDASEDGMAERIVADLIAKARAASAK